MAFDEVQFPVDVSRGSKGGPERRTSVVELGSGREERNSPWASSRRRYDVAYGIRTADELHAVVAFFEARRAKLYGFRFKDWSDYRSCPPLQNTTALDQAIGTGDGTKVAFQLVKTYGDVARTYVREIRKPVAGSVKIAVAGVQKTLGTHYSLDTTTGVVTFVTGSKPTAGQAVTAGYEFDVPVRFDADRIDVDLDHFRAGEIGSIPLIELKL